jgi:hypothetical protein
MAGVSIGVVWLGYLLVYYGVTQVQGANFGILDLMLPSRASKLGTIPYDDGHTLTNLTKIDQQAGSGLPAGVTSVTSSKPGTLTLHGNRGNETINLGTGRGR